MNPISRLDRSTINDQSMMMIMPPTGKSIDTAQSMTRPKVLEQGNGYVDAESAFRMLRAISLKSDTLVAGAQWILNPAAVKTRSAIAGEGVLWGNGVLWGGGFFQGDGVLWGDSLMIYKQSAMASGVLWGDSALG